MKLSVTSKLDGIRSWSLQALDTCPASKKSDGTLVDACSGCYATRGHYYYPSVKAPREFNKVDWKRAEWVTDMVHELDNDRYFRWFDSGDMYSVALAKKILTVMQLTPWVKHWLPTRMAKYAKFRAILADMELLPNVKTRFSSDSINGVYIAKVHGSVISPTVADMPTGVTVCMAYENAGKCNGCRACWDKSVSVIGYPAHGATMKKIIRLQSV